MALIENTTVFDQGKRAIKTDLPFGSFGSFFKNILQLILLKFNLIQSTSSDPKKVAYLFKNEVPKNTGT